MIIDDFPVRTPCCGGLALRSVMTVIHVGDDLAEFGASVAEGLHRQNICPHCGSEVNSEECQGIANRFNIRMERYMFSGIPPLEINPHDHQTP